MHLERIPWAKMFARLLSLAVCMAYPLSARDKTDVIVLTNSDRIPFSSALVGATQRRRGGSPRSPRAD